MTARTGHAGLVRLLWYRGGLHGLIEVLKPRLGWLAHASRHHILVHEHLCLGLGLGLGLGVKGILKGLFMCLALSKEFLNATTDLLVVRSLGKY